MNPNPSRAQYLRTSPDREQRPQIPATAEAARTSLAWWQQRATDAYRRFEAAKRQFLECRGELAVVQAVARNEYDPNADAYAIGSSGPWPVRYREVSLDDWSRA